MASCNAEALVDSLLAMRRGQQGSAADVAVRRAGERARGFGLLHASELVAARGVLPAAAAKRSGDVLDGSPQRAHAPPQRAGGARAWLAPLPPRASGGGGGDGSAAAAADASEWWSVDDARARERARVYGGAHASWAQPNAPRGQRLLPAPTAGLSARMPAGCAAARAGSAALAEERLALAAHALAELSLRVRAFLLMSARMRDALPTADWLERAHASTTQAAERRRREQLRAQLGGGGGGGVSGSAGGGARPAWTPALSSTPLGARDGARGARPAQFARLLAELRCALAYALEASCEPTVSGARREQLALRLLLAFAAWLPIPFFSDPLWRGWCGGAQRGCWPPLAARARGAVERAALDPARANAAADRHRFALAEWAARSAVRAHGGVDALEAHAARARAVEPPGSPGGRAPSPRAPRPRWRASRAPGGGDARAAAPDAEPARDYHFAPPPLATIAAIDGGAALSALEAARADARLYAEAEVLLYGGRGRFARAHARLRVWRALAGEAVEGSAVDVRLLGREATAATRLQRACRLRRLRRRHRAACRLVRAWRQLRLRRLRARHALRRELRAVRVRLLRGEGAPAALRRLLCVGAARTLSRWLRGPTYRAACAARRAAALLVQTATRRRLGLHSAARRREMRQRQASVALTQLAERDAANRLRAAWTRHSLRRLAAARLYAAASNLPALVADAARDERALLARRGDGALVDAADAAGGRASELAALVVDRGRFGAADEGAVLGLICALALVAARARAEGAPVLLLLVEARRAAARAGMHALKEALARERPSAIRRSDALQKAVNSPIGAGAGEDEAGPLGAALRATVPLPADADARAAGRRVSQASALHVKAARGGHRGPGGGGGGGGGGLLAARAKAIPAASVIQRFARGHRARATLIAARALDANSALDEATLWLVLAARVGAAADAVDKAAADAERRARVGDASLPVPTSPAAREAARRAADLATTAVRAALDARARATALRAAAASVAELARADDAALVDYVGQLEAEADALDAAAAARGLAAAAARALGEMRTRGLAVGAVDATRAYADLTPAEWQARARDGRELAAALAGEAEQTTDAMLRWRAAAGRRRALAHAREGSAARPRALLDALRLRALRHAWAGEATAARALRGTPAAAVHAAAGLALLGALDGSGGMELIEGCVCVQVVLADVSPQLSIGTRFEPHAAALLADLRAWYALPERFSLALTRVASDATLSAPGGVRHLLWLAVGLVRAPAGEGARLAPAQTEGFDEACAELEAAFAPDMNALGGVAKAARLGAFWAELGLDSSDESYADMLVVSVARPTLVARAEPALVERVADAAGAAAEAQRRLDAVASAQGAVAQTRMLHWRRGALVFARTALAASARAASAGDASAGAASADDVSAAIAGDASASAADGAAVAAVAAVPSALALTSLSSMGWRMVRENAEGAPLFEEAARRKRERRAAREALATARAELDALSRLRLGTVAAWHARAPPVPGNDSLSINVWWNFFITTPPPRPGDAGYLPGLGEGVRYDLWAATALGQLAPQPWASSDERRRAGVREFEPDVFARVRAELEAALRASDALLPRAAAASAAAKTARRSSYALGAASFMLAAKLSGKPPVEKRRARGVASERSGEAGVPAQHIGFADGTVAPRRATGAPSPPLHGYASLGYRARRWIDSQREAESRRRLLAGRIGRHVDVGGAGKLRGLGQLKGLAGLEPSSLLDALDTHVDPARMRSMAETLGLRLEAGHAHLRALWLAAELSVAPLPRGWREERDPSRPEGVVFANSESGETAAVHPFAAVFKAAVKSATRNSCGKYRPPSAADAWWQFAVDGNDRALVWVNLVTGEQRSSLPLEVFAKHEESWAAPPSFEDVQLPLVISHRSAALRQYVPPPDAAAAPPGETTLDGADARSDGDLASSRVDGVPLGSEAAPPPCEDASEHAARDAIQTVAPPLHGDLADEGAPADAGAEPALLVSVPVDAPAVERRIDDERVLERSSGVNAASAPPAAAPASLVGERAASAPRHAPSASSASSLGIVAKGGAAAFGIPNSSVATLDQGGTVPAHSVAALTSDAVCAEAGTSAHVLSPTAAVELCALLEQQSVRARARAVRFRPRCVEEIRAMAHVLGIDSVSQPHLLWIADAALAEPVPVGWMLQDGTSWSAPASYTNLATGLAQWEHPGVGRARGILAALIGQLPATLAQVESASSQRRRIT